MDSVCKGNIVKTYYEYFHFRKIAEKKGKKNYDPKNLIMKNLSRKINFVYRTYILRKKN